MSTHFAPANIGFKQDNAGSYPDQKPSAPYLTGKAINPDTDGVLYYCEMPGSPVFFHVVEDIPGEFWLTTGAPKQRVVSVNSITGERKIFSEEKWS